MITKHNFDISSICWLSGTYGELKCYADNYFIPETLNEFEEICRELYENHEEFDVIGHTSNIYFKPGYHTSNLISTRKLNKWKEYDDHIWCECGVHVKSLSKEMVEEGIKGFAGLVDLPGTVGAGVYGNAGCYGDGFSTLVVSAKVLTRKGVIFELSKEDFGFRKRSSVLKRHEIDGVILSVKLKKEYGEFDIIRNEAINNHELRKRTQPGPQNNLGSIFKYRNCLTLRGRIIKGISAIIAKLTHPTVPSSNLAKEKTYIACKLMRQRELAEYLPYGFNRYIWSSHSAHDRFDQYVSMYKKIFKDAELEIEIKQ